MKLITDGSYSTKTGRGGWAFVTEDYDFHASWGSEEGPTTNQRMEMMAVREGLRFVMASGIKRVEVITDSAYITNCFKYDWFTRWEKTAWTNVKGEPIANQDLWFPIRDFNQAITITWSLVKGHSGHELNELADRLAVEARQGKR